MRPLDAIRQFLSRRGITDCRIYAALSGGADSVCLLVCLKQLEQPLRLEIRAIHVQHGLRGEESLRDEQFCRELCAELGVPLSVAVCDVNRYAQEHGISSIELAARECRYQAFSEHCRDGCVATAHTASDNLETLLLRLARGTGLRGLCGIPPVREPYIRPMLETARKDVEAFLEEQGIPYVTDSTNLEDVYTRNFIRHEIVPALKKCNPSVEATAAAMLPSLREDMEFLEQAADAAYREHRQEDGSLYGVQNLPPAMQARCIARLLREHGIPDNLRNITIIRKLLQTGGSAELEYRGIRAVAGRQTLLLAKPEASAASVPLKIGKNQIYPAKYLEAELFFREDAEKFERIHTMFANSAMDYDIIKGNAILHGRLPGLRYLPAGKTHHVSIKKWLNAEVPPAKRGQLHFLSDADGLLWAEGLGTAERAAVTEKTERMLVLQIFQ